MLIISFNFHSAFVSFSKEFHNLKNSHLGETLMLFRKFSILFMDFLELKCNTSGQ